MRIFRNLSLAFMAASCLSLGATPLVEDAPITVSTTDTACAQLYDANYWTTWSGYMSGVGTVTTMATLLNNLNQSAPFISDSDHEPAISYDASVKFSPADMSTVIWSPQGLSLSNNGSKQFAIVSWHYVGANGSEAPNGSRITVMDVTDIQHVTYRNVILVEPTGNHTYKAVQTHAGGVAVLGNYLYVTNTGAGFDVFDLNQFRYVGADSSLCQNADGSGVFGLKSGHWCADAYDYMLPMVNKYNTPSVRSNGATMPAACKPKFSYAGTDKRQATSILLSGEYCNVTGDYCNGDTTGLNGRLYQWPVASGGKLQATNRYVTPLKVFFVNQRNINGIAPDLVKDGSGNYALNTYWLASRRHDSSIIKVSPTDNAKWWSVDDSQAPYSPEGMHSTDAGQHLWILTEGNGDGAGGVNTDPATGGRTLTVVYQGPIN